MIRFITLTAWEVLQLHTSLAYSNPMCLELQDSHHQQHLPHTDQESQERVT